MSGRGTLVMISVSGGGRGGEGGASTRGERGCRH